MDPVELARLLDEAAEKGARKALESVGLHGEDAGKDIQDLRTLLNGWREAKSTVLKTFVQWLTIGVLGLLSATLWLKMGVSK